MQSTYPRKKRSRASAYPNVQQRTETLIKSPTPERITFSPIVVPNSKSITPERPTFSPIVVPNSKPQTQPKNITIPTNSITDSITNIKDMIKDVAKNYKKEKWILDGFKRTRLNIARELDNTLEQAIKRKDPRVNNPRNMERYITYLAEQSHLPQLDKQIYEQEDIVSELFNEGNRLVQLHNIQEAADKEHNDYIDAGLTFGGKRKTNKRKTNKKKTNKRKTNKRKTNKGKSNKKR